MDTSQIKVSKDLASLVGELCFELRKYASDLAALKELRSYRFVMDEIDKFDESLNYGAWHCKVGAYRILRQKDDKGYRIFYNPGILRLAEKVRDYAELEQESQKSKKQS